MHPALTNAVQRWIKAQDGHTLNGSPGGQLGGNIQHSIQPENLNGVNSRSDEETGGIASGNSTIAEKARTTTITAATTFATQLEEHH
jgi:hypothetical protein